MTIDRYTKVVLTVIAVALILLVLQPFYAPTLVQAGNSEHLGPWVGGIHNDVKAIANGTCRNSKLC